MVMLVVVLLLTFLFCVYLYLMYVVSSHRMGGPVASDRVKILSFRPRCRKDAADCGNLRAAGNLADMMVSGKGVRKDLSAASSLYAAVAKGPARGRAVPAKAADDGRTGQCDPGLSFRLFKQAADNGDQYAMYAVACMYRDGKGTSEDREKYKFYTRMAADFGNMDAKEIVGKWDAKEKKRRKAAKKADP